MNEKKNQADTQTPQGYIINNKYKILKKIGMGSFGSIFQTVDIRKIIDIIIN